MLLVYILYRKKRHFIDKYNVLGYIQFKLGYFSLIVKQALFA